RNRYDRSFINQFGVHCSICGIEPDQVTDEVMAILNATQNMFLISIYTVVNAAVQFRLGWVARSFLSRSLICTGKTGMSFGVGMVKGPGKRCAA
ncbi:MAG: hypothetical protein EBS72_09675, partial [Rhizobiales bacterium]|nr:hypothetical protein [Hyphomicrobiales bacterium]